jgi:peptidoglycan-associated lipoprotein
MKNLQKFLSLALASSVLLLAACSKKPVRDANAGALGTDNSTVDPNAIAIPADNIAPGTTLEQRTATGQFGQSVVEPVYFEFDRSAVPATQRAKIEAAVKWLKDNPEKRMLLEGHCDWRGTAEYNLGLGDRRANAVRRYLESLGIPAARLETLSKGSVDAKQTGTDADWAKDRRVDFIELNK